MAEPGYFDSFSIIFGWWHSSPVVYRYYSLGDFYIKQSYSKSHYVAQSYTKNYYMSVN